MPPKGRSSKKASKPTSQVSPVSSERHSAVSASTTADNRSAEEDDLSTAHIFNKAKSHYLATTSTRIIILDVFLLFLIASGGLQTLYMILVGTFPFNAYLSGMMAAVGTFTLTLGLRLQVTKPEAFNGITPERAFVDFLFCNLLLHVAVLTFLG